MIIPKKQYQVPALTVVEFKMERGYVASIMSLADPEELSRAIEERVTQEAIWTEANDLINAGTNIEGRMSDGSISGNNGWLDQDGYF